MNVKVKSSPPRTPSPWRLESKGWNGLFIMGDDERVPGKNRLIAEASLMYDGAEANAAHIVRCVNSHEALVKALDSCLDLLSFAGYNSANSSTVTNAEAALAAAGAPQ